MRIIFLLTILNLAFSDTKYCISSDCFEKKTTIENKEYPLQGAGIFRYFGFKIYAASLYADSKANILANTPKKLVIRYFREFTSAEIADSGEKEMKKQKLVDLTKIESQTSQMRQIYKSVKENDEYSIEYLPGRGINLYLNNKLQGTIPGDDFAKAYYGIWLSDKPISTTLREQIFDNEIK